MTTAPVLPDDRLCVLTYAPGLITGTVREGHVSEPLLRDVQEFLRHLSRSDVLAYDPVPGTHRTTLITAWKPVSDDRLYGSIGQLLAVVRDGDHLEFRVNARHVCPALCREITEEVVPRARNVLYIPTALGTGTRPSLGRGRAS
jgi:hypothetical protein